MVLFRLNMRCECSDSCQCPGSSQARVKINPGLAGTKIQRKTFCQKRNDSEFHQDKKNDGCRIPLHLWAYNHLGRNQITNNSSSDGLPEIDVQAAGDGHTENVALLLEQQSKRLGQKPGGRSWLRLAVPAEEPQLLSEVPASSGQGWAGLSVPHLLGAWGTAQQQEGGAGFEKFKMLASCRQLQKS